MRTANTIGNQLAGGRHRTCGSRRRLPVHQQSTSISNAFTARCAGIDVDAQLSRQHLFAIDGEV
ncbi:MULTISPECIES: hypothetical protein [Stenotrophomonas maltophilia group]|jgi:hypothetical protein|uniref:Uncharacterized protein n=1 Tax=Stenotrophomonas maltophilia TaxID=40324 RepID=A0A246IDE3_STEMA|nr:MULTISPECIES: hypothetical protein [Stenotrophomonas maltophilia group]MCZ7843072.1 hypothetical protein [Stenotrophomonas maltophilia]MDJ1624568.1 hypothetical protein [Stenotrophomonas sepilia]OWQ78050.1 hypothetical protein CEE63_03300 [Stenotrophomonas maltophilia]PZT35378.1 hypothetical protein A7X97_01050 [Stenotrophomonas sepilia]